MPVSPETDLGWHDLPFSVDKSATDEQHATLEYFSIDILSNPALVRDCLEAYFMLGRSGNIHHHDSFEKANNFIQFLAENPAALPIIDRLRIIVSNRLDMDLIKFSPEKEAEIDSHPKTSRLLSTFKHNPDNEGFRTQWRRFRLLFGLGLVDSIDDIKQFP